MSYSCHTYCVTRATPTAHSSGLRDVTPAPIPKTSLLPRSLLHRLGRKPLLVGSFLGMGGTMLLMAAALALPVLAPLAPLCAVVGTVRHRPSHPSPPSHARTGADSSQRPLTPTSTPSLTPSLTPTLTPTLTPASTPNLKT